MRQTHICYPSNPALADGGGQATQCIDIETDWTPGDAWNDWLNLQHDKLAALQAIAAQQGTVVGTSDTSTTAASSSTPASTTGQPAQWIHGIDNKWLLIGGAVALFMFSGSGRK